jgi:hypothetical protein
MQAQVCIPEWPTAFYLQAIALSKLGMETDAQDMLNDGAAFEAKRQSSWRICNLIYIDYSQSKYLNILLHARNFDMQLYHDIISQVKQNF